MSLANSVIFILNRNNEVAGTGFLVGPGLAVTCAHVVRSASNNENHSIEILWETVNTTENIFESQRRTAAILQITDDDDVAILEFEEPLPSTAKPLQLVTAPLLNHETPFLTYGAPRGLERAWGAGVARGLIPHPTRPGHICLQLNSNEIDIGMSGAPVQEKVLDYIIGMVSTVYQPLGGRFADVSCAIPAETIIRYLDQNVPLRIRTPIYIPWEYIGENFIGREEEIVHLDGLVDQVNLVGITGAVGIGKTALLAKAAYHLRDRFTEGIYGIDASNGIESGLRSTASLRFGVGDSFSRLLKHITQEAATLLLIDNLPSVQALEDARQNGLLTEFKGSIIFTINTLPGNSTIPVLRLNPLSDEAAIRLLKNTVKRENPHLDLDAHRSNLQRLCRLVGNVPFAIQITGNQLIRIYNGDVDACVSTLSTTTSELLSDRKLRILITNQIQQLSRNAQRLLRLTVNFHSRTIQETDLEFLYSLTTNEINSRDEFLLALEEIKHAFIVTPQLYQRIEIAPLISEFIEEQLQTIDEDLDIVTREIRQQNVLAGRIQERLAITSFQIQPQLFTYQVHSVAQLLPHLTWQARIRQAVINALITTLTASESILSISDRRESAMLLFQLRWLEDNEDIEVKLLLAVFELIARFATSEIELHRLLQDANSFTQRPMSLENQIMLFTYRSRFIAQIYQATSEENRSTFDIEQSLADAELTCNLAVELSKHLDGLTGAANYSREHIAEQQRIASRAYLIAGNILSLRAETDTVNRDALLQNAISHLNRAKEFAELADSDIALLVSIYRELSFNYEMVGGETGLAQSKTHHLQSQALLRTREDEIKDRDVADYLWSLVYEHSSYLAWELGEQYQREGDLETAVNCYREAFEVSVAEIERLRESSYFIHSLIVAYVNAGYYLQCLRNILPPSQHDAQFSPCGYWEKAFLWAQKYGYWRLQRKAQRYINENCPS